VRTVVEQLLTTGRVVRAYLGVSLDPDFNVDAASALKLDRVRGARVLRVNPDTPADRAQMRIDDVVLTYDGTEVQDENHLINMVSLTPVGRRVRMVVFREGKYVNLDITLTDRENLEKQESERRK
jgi:serine protease Do